MDGISSKSGGLILEGWTSVSRKRLPSNKVKPRTGVNLRALILKTTLKLIKTKSEACPRCGCTDFKMTGSGKACVDCFTYIPAELRDIRKLRD